MPLDRYGVLVARALEVRRAAADETPHVELHLMGAADEHWRVAVNVASKQPPSELLYLVQDDFRHPVTVALQPLGDGWHELAPGSAGPRLDYVRGHLFDPAGMRLLPPDAAGPANDLSDLLEHHLQRAIGDGGARVIAFGQRFAPQPGVRDEVFGFEPVDGVHDIHMNQGSVGRFARDNGVRQDGALLLHLPAAARWVAMFFAFQSQAFHTDDDTGDPIAGGGPARR
jgi:uncharacterized protein YukJ